MSNFDIGIRVDMGGNIGSGHFFRCLSIAKELKKNGKTVIFLISDEKEFRKHVKKMIPCIVLKEKTVSKKILECKKLMNRIRLLIIDLPHYEEKYGIELKNKNIVLINDLGKMKIFSKILINGSIVKKFHKYQIKNKSSKLLIDSKYMILREEFLKRRIESKINDRPIRNILITFGGSGENKITNKLLKLLLKKDFHITVIVGPSNTKQNILKLIKNNHKIKLIINPNNIAELFSKQDMIFSSTGITIYELACLGIPTVMIPINSAQNDTAKEMEKRGFGKIMSVNNINLENIQKILLNFDDYKFRKEMHKSGRKIVDGEGTSRIAKAIEKIC